MSIKFQIRRDLANNWSNTNPTLASGEIGFEINTNKLKIGNGSDTWNTLSYIASGVADYDTPSVVSASVISNGINFIRTAGYYAAGDGGGALYKKLSSAPSGSTGAGTPYIVSNSGTYYWELVISESVINVLQLGAFSNGFNAAVTANAINGAIHHLPNLDVSYGGGVVFIPAGSYSISNTSININKSFITLQGAGSQATRLVFSNMANTDWIRITPTSANVATRRQCVYDLMLESGENNFATYNITDSVNQGRQPGEVSGASLKIMGLPEVEGVTVYDVKVERVAIENTLCGIDIGNQTNNITLRDMVIIPNQVNSLFGINWHCPVSPTLGSETDRSDVVTLNNILINGQNYNSNVIGIQMRGFVQTLLGESVRILVVDKGMVVGNQTASANTPDFINITDFQIEGCRKRSLEITHGREFKFVNFDIFNLRGVGGNPSEDDDCILIAGADATRKIKNVIFTNGAIGQCGNAGIRISNALDVKLSDVIFRSCSQSGVGNYPAIEIEGSANGIIIDSVLADDDGNSTSYGAVINSGAERIFIDNLDASRSVTGAVNDGSSYGSTFISNIIGPKKNDSFLKIPSNAIDFGASDANNTILNIGRGATGNKFALVDFIGDTTHTDYGLRIGRKNDGANGTSAVEHRGTGPLVVNAIDNGVVEFGSNNIIRLSIKSAGTVRFVPLSAPPTSGNVAGDVYYDSVMNRLRYFNGTQWANTNQ